MKLFERVLNRKCYEFFGSIYSYERLLKYLHKVGIAKNTHINSNVDISYSGAYNCWGLTAYLHGWNNRLAWICDDEMEEALALYTRVLDSDELPTVGDIAVYRICGQLEHTATVVRVNVHDPHNPMLLHKPGSWRICYESVQSIDNYHGRTYGNNIEWVRPIA